MFSKIELKLLEEKAQSLPDVVEGNPAKFSYRFDDGFLVRCFPTKPALMSLLKKLRKAKKLGTRGKIRPRSMGRAYSSVTFEDFVRDGEYDNAVQYNKQFDREVLFSAGKHVLIRCEPIPGDDRFVLARFFLDDKLQPWCVYHVDSGVRFFIGHTKVGILTEFANVALDRLHAAIEKVDCTFQAGMKANY